MRTGSASLSTSLSCPEDFPRIRRGHVIQWQPLKSVRVRGGLPCLSVASRQRSGGVGSGRSDGREDGIEIRQVGKRAIGGRRGQFRDG